MNYGTIKKVDIADGLGVRVSLFVSGCRVRCKNCQNQITWDFGFGKPFTKETEDEILEDLKPEYIQGLTVLGGEPFEPENQEALAPFLERVKKTVLPLVTQHTASKNKQSSVSCVHRGSVQRGVISPVVKFIFFIVCGDDMKSGYM